MTKKASLAILIASVFSGVYGQENAGSTKISGSLDAYYRFNARKGNNLTSFTNKQNSFELGMASLKAEHKFNKASVVADLGFGTRAEEFSYNDKGTLLALKQAYVIYSPIKSVKLTMGKFATHIGYEVLDASGNKNYSMSYMFSFGPFFHTGLKADIGLGDKSAIMLGVANAADHTTIDFLKNGGEKSVLAQFTTASSEEKLKVALNFVGNGYGTNLSRSQIDAVVTCTVTDKLGIGYNGTTTLFKPEKGNSSNWWGSAIYVNYAVKQGVDFIWRSEYFSDKKYATTPVASNIFQNTLSANFKAGFLTLIPELRIDNAQDPVFPERMEALQKTLSLPFLLRCTAFNN
ncbi:MAG: porin [Sphingobacteriales bacterium]|nr:porin [Sphingobacteriales bacterium]